MSVLSITQHAFTTGQVGEHIFTRDDIAQFASAAKKIINLAPLEQGPLIFRNGTTFVGQTKYPDKTTRIDEFKFSVEQTLLLEIGHLYMRFYVSGAQVIVAPTTWITLEEYVPGNIVEAAFAKNYRCLVEHTAGSFTGDLSSDYWETIEDTAGATDFAYEIPLPFVETVVNEISMSGTADVIYFAHQSVNPVEVARYANDDWRLTIFPFDDGPYNALNTDVLNKASLSGVTGTKTLTTTGSTFDLAESVGKLFMIQRPPTNLEEGAVAVMRITAVSSVSSATVELEGTVDSDFTGGGYSSWRIGVFGSTTPGEADEYIDVKFDPYDPGDGVPIQITWRFNKTNTYNGKPRYIATVKLFPWMLFTLDMELRWNNVKWEIWRPAYILWAISHPALQLYYNDAVTATAPTDDEGWLMSGAGGGIDTVTDAGSSGETNDTWPGKVSIHQERLIFANTAPRPQTMYFSQIAGYKNFSPVNEQAEVLDDSAFTYSLAGSRTIDAIEWMLSSDQLVIGTAGNEFVSKTSNASAPITPTDVSFIRQSNRGSAAFQTARLVGGTVVYVQRLGGVVRALSYDVAKDRHTSEDLTKLVDSILTGDGIIGSAHRHEPSSALYYYTKSGRLLSLTFEEDESVVAWSEFILGGTAAVTSLAVLPNVILNEITYMITQRTIDGNSVQYIEAFTNGVFEQNYWQYLDCALEYHGDAITVAAGMDHLEGEVVTIFADGEVRGTGIVVEGSIALGGSYTDVRIGYPYSSSVQLLHVETKLESGSTYGKQKRVIEMTIHLKEESVLKAGLTEGGVEIVIADEEEPNIYKYQPESDFKYRTGDLWLVHDTATPFTIQAVTREIEFRD